MTDSSLRLFVAVPLPSELKQPLSNWSEKLRQELPFRKWVHSSDLHITLQFLGDAPSRQLHAIADALRSGTFSGMSSFELTLDRLRLFGRTDNPSVLWIGVTGGLSPLHALQQAVVSALAPLGFKAESRPYHPHITLARNYNGVRPFDQELPDRFAAPAAPDGAPLGWTVDHIVLYSSNLNQPPPFYKELERVPLG